MIIRYGSATLRPIEERDFDLLLSMINNPDIEDMTVGWNWPIDERQQKEFIRIFHNSEKSIKLMIELSNEKTIGMIAAEQIDWKNRKAEIGIKISSSMDNRIQGDTTDACIGLLGYLFNELGMNCVYAKFLEENIRSKRLWKKLHFYEEALLRQRIFKKGKYRNIIIMSILRDEFNVHFI